MRTMKEKNTCQQVCVNIRNFLIIANLIPLYLIHWTKLNNVEK